MCREKTVASSPFQKDDCETEDTIETWICHFTGQNNNTKAISRDRPTYDKYFALKIPIQTLLTTKLRSWLLATYAIIVNILIHSSPHERKKKRIECIKRLLERCCRSNYSQLIHLERTHYFVCPYMIYEAIFIILSFLRHLSSYFHSLFESGFWTKCEDWVN